MLDNPGFQEYAEHNLVKKHAGTLSAPSQCSSWINQSRLPYCLIFEGYCLSSRIWCANGSHDNFDYSLEPFHLLFDIASSSSGCKRHGTANICWLAGSFGNSLGEPSCKIEGLCLDIEWCAQRDCRRLKPLQYSISMAESSKLIFCRVLHLV
jgi:hypothetical protein